MRERKPIIKVKVTGTPRAPLFNVTTLKRMAEDQESGRVKLKTGNRQTVKDEIQPGLMAYVYKGYWTYHVEYRVKGQPPGKRPHMKIGEHPKMSMAEAREIAKTIRYLGSQGVDVEDGLMDRLIAELKRDGIQWRGGMAPKP